MLHKMIIDNKVIVIDVLEQICSHFPSSTPPWNSRVRYICLIAYNYEDFDCLPLTDAFSNEAAISDPKT